MMMYLAISKELLTLSKYFAASGIMKLDEAGWVIGIMKLDEAGGIMKLDESLVQGEWLKEVGEEDDDDEEVEDEAFKWYLECTY